MRYPTRRCVAVDAGQKHGRLFCKNATERVAKQLWRCFWVGKRVGSCKLLCLQAHRTHPDPSTTARHSCTLDTARDAQQSSSTQHHIRRIIHKLQIPQVSLVLWYTDNDAKQRTMSCCFGKYNNLMIVRTSIVASLPPTTTNPGIRGGKGGRRRGTLARAVVAVLLPLPQKRNQDRSHQCRTTVSCQDRG